MDQWIIERFRPIDISLFEELSDHVKLERLFTARNIERLADIQVIWTSNLADHLQLEDDDTKVRLFSHTSFLELHREW